MGKKLFVLLILAMVLVTLASLVLTLTGHEEMVRAAFGWMAHSVTSVAETLGALGVVVLVMLVCG